MYALQKINNGTINDVLDFSKTYEAACVDFVECLRTLKTKMAQGEPCEKILAYCVTEDNIIKGVFCLNERKTFLHCFPQFDAMQANSFFDCAEKFFSQQVIRCIMGEKNFTDILENFLVNNFNYQQEKKCEYYLLAKDAGELQQQDALLSFENCSVCEMSDAKNLLEVEIGYECEELGVKNPNEYFSLKYLKQMLKEQTVFKYEVAGKIISRVHTNAVGINCKQFGGVYTIKDFRRYGAAKKLLQYAMHTLAPTTKTFVLFVRIKNKAAAHLYDNLGFKKIHEFTIIDLALE